MAFFSNSRSASIASTISTSYLPLAVANARRSSLDALLKLWTIPGIQTVSGMFGEGRRLSACRSGWSQFLTNNNKWPPMFVGLLTLFYSLLLILFFVIQLISYFRLSSYLRCASCDCVLADAGFVRNAGRALCRDCHAKEKASGLGRCLCHRCHTIIDEAVLKFKGSFLGVLFFVCLIQMQLNYKMCRYQNRQHPPYSLHY